MVSHCSPIFVAAAIGFLFVTRGTVMRRVRGVGADGKPVAPSEPEFPLTVAMLTACTLVAGNRVELALNGDGTFDRLWTDLQSAKQAITLQMYYMGPGRTADRLAEILAERARAGVSVSAITVARPSLDDVYLRHTGRAFRAAAMEVNS